MWHEARKQERKIRGMLVDYRKRAERRQDFYEKIVRKCSVRTTAIKEKSNCHHTNPSMIHIFFLFLHFPFFENENRIQKADPTQFMQIHGRRCKIHLDPAVAAAGESPAIMQVIFRQQNGQNYNKQLEISISI